MRSCRSDFRPSLIEPPRQKIFLRQAILRNGVVNQGRWFIAQRLLRREQTKNKFAVFASNFASGSRSEIGSKVTVLLKHRLTKCHVRSEGHLVQGGGIRSEI